MSHTPSLHRLILRASQVALLTLATCVGAYAQRPLAAEEQATGAFEASVQDYARLHRQLERQIGSIEFGTPIAEINRIIHQLAASLRAERRDAARGDLFTLAVSAVLRVRIYDALVSHGYTIDDVRDAARVDGIDYSRVSLRVNDEFPWALATAMPACVLATAMPACVLDVLPLLPAELQYRFVDDDLVLIDVHASLIVDILPGALTNVTAR